MEHSFQNSYVSNDGIKYPEINMDLIDFNENTDFSVGPDDQQNNINEIDLLNNENNGDIDVIMKDSNFQKQLKSLASDLGIDFSDVITEAKKNLKLIYSTHDKFNTDFSVKLFKSLIDMGFDSKIDIDYSQIKKLNDLMGKYPVAFVSSHKSYLDLFIFGIMMSKCELPLPYIFSGDNLNIPLFGDLVKKSGVIFIKRNARDDQIYKATLRHFLNWLVKQDNTHFVWSIEGTRSRSGKMSDPKLGILKYLESEKNIKYVPVSIIYDLIPDLDEMSLETQGKNKKKENIDWMIGYFRKLGISNGGKISIRFGDAIDSPEITDDLSDFGNYLIRQINNITPVTSVSLICNTLLNRIAVTKNCLINSVKALLEIGNIDEKLYVDRNLSLTKSVERGLDLLIAEDIIRKQDDRYIINHYKYFQAAYYSNLSIHYFYHRAFVEMGLFKSNMSKSNQPNMSNQLSDTEVFWKEVIFQRNFFGVEFFYTDEFKSEIQKELDIIGDIKDQKILVASAVLGNCLAGYRIVGEALARIGDNNTMSDQEFIQYCLFLSEELHWLGKIKRVESTSVSFLYNGMKLVKYLGIWSGSNSSITIENFNNKINRISRILDKLTAINLEPRHDLLVPLIEPVKSNPLTKEILNGERGSHIGAFFDMDKTLIKGYSVWSFAKNRLMSGKAGSHEIMSQILGASEYLKNNNNTLPNIVKTLKNVKEQDFIDLGNDVYLNDITIYDESYDLVEAHRAMGHTVCIISAAISYQVEPIAKKLGIDIIECTRLEVNNGKFTGNITQLCAKEGKAEAGKRLASQYSLDLNKTYFYTDSYEDISLLKLVGNPRPTNPDIDLISESHKEGWDVKNYAPDNTAKIENLIRTGLAYSKLGPALIAGYNKDGVEGALEAASDLVFSTGGVSLRIVGHDKLWKQTAIIIVNHQSQMDTFVLVQLYKTRGNKKCVAIAKEEVRKIPIFGKMIEEAGTIFIDVFNKDNAIKALEPAVQGLKDGTSIVIFPEGTRSFTRKLGPFKKGAFHMAMQAGVPLIPIILKNTHDILPRGSSIINPGIIDVVVLDSIPTTNWTLDNMNEKIEEVRNLFLKELNQL